MRYLFVFLALFVLLPAYGLELTGVFKQGGFIMGQTDPKARVFLGDAETRVNEKGYFVIGIPRDQQQNSTVKVRLMDAIEETHTVNVEQRTYNVQAIKGVKKEHVNPLTQHMLQIKDDKRQILEARGVFESLPLQSLTFVNPMKDPYRISGVYGSKRTYNGEERNWHKGVDFAAPTGTPVYAPASGVVRLALADSFFNGNLVILDHGQQFMTIYAHLHSMDVQKGDIVSTGDMLGKVGSTGRSTGPHLHWGLYWRNMPLDPMLLLQ